MIEPILLLFAMIAAGGCLAATVRDRLGVAAYLAGVSIMFVIIYLALASSLI